MNDSISKAWIVPFETNDIDAFIPEVWANESVAILLENMVVGNLVHKDFSTEIASFGDVVNTRQPAAYTAKRKTDADTVTIQNTEATNIPVKLNQHWHTSFLIRDGQESKAFKNLVSEYLEPAIVSIAQAVDKMLLGQSAQFVSANNVAGGLGALSSSNGKDYILDTRKVMNDNKAPAFGRNLILSSESETYILKDDTFTSAEKVGDEGTALREASLGKKLGFSTFMCQNTPSYTNSDVNTADAINNSAGYAAGATSIVLDDSSVAAVGDYIKVAGDNTPQLVTANNGTTETLTISPGLNNAVADNAVVTVYDAALIDYTAGYSLDYSKYVHLDGLAYQPQVGQIIRIASSTSDVSTGYFYTIMEVSDYNATNDECDVLLDRPLEVATADNYIVSLLPSGSYNMAFTQNAIALVSRPLAAPMRGTGALSAVASYDGLAVRVTITYDGDKQGHLVTVDLLCGVKVLDDDLGAVMLG